MPQHRILFIELLGGIGDLIIALPAIHALAKSHPAARMTVLTFAPGDQLLQTDPLIDEVVIAPRGEAKATVDRLLSQESFDLIVTDTTYDGIAEAVQQAGAERVVTNLWRSPPENQLVSDRFLAILQREGLIQPEFAQRQAQIHVRASERIEAQQKLGAAYRPLVFFCIDAGMAIKRWADESFVQLGQALQQQYGASIQVVVGADRETAVRIAKSLGGRVSLWERGSLRQLAAAFSFADLVIGADTGPVRIAAAMNAPTITLFGPSWHGRYGQPEPQVDLQGYPQCGDRRIHNFTEQDCWYSGSCPLEWQTCLDEITPSQVLDAARSLLENRREIVPDASVPQNIHQNVSQSILEIIPQNIPQNVPQLINSNDSWRSVRNLLVMRLDNIGDVMMTSPTLRALRENLPDAKITLMASPGGMLTAPLLPWIDEVLPWRVLWQDLGRLDFNPAREWELIETLRRGQFDAAVILTSFSQSPHPAGLICALAGIPLRLGESKETDLGTLTHAVPPAPDEIHQVDRNLRLVESIGFTVTDRALSLHIPPEAQTSIDRLLQTKGITPETPYLVLNPWTTCQSRNYAPNRFAEAALRLSQITGWSVVVTGVEKDRDRSHEILSILGNRAIDLMGMTTLAEVVALIAKAKLVLTNNTSTMHIVDALRVPNVVMFAGTEYECQWQPRYSPSRLLRRPTVCSPCYAFACPHSLECLDIQPETIVQAALSLLQCPEIG
ncbi:glycosyltransferase family 9 protein [Leptolyngbya ohadii]|uniref:glycosyltransferase family 9 protein n=1 Tax=Leptolyngbya ohadii TaxID=1962290 RepID=UPI000B59E32F|nr:glycosyltransferase family 9 protein [Leptolyngbya ohadii]